MNVHSKPFLTLAVSTLSILSINFGMHEKAFAQTQSLPQGSLEKERKESGPYFRVKINLLYKGKPQSFNYVAGCNARVTALSQLF